MTPVITHFGSRSDQVQYFYSVLNRGGYVAAEGLLTLLNYGSLSLTARTLRGIVDLHNHEPRYQHLGPEVQ